MTHEELRLKAMELALKHVDGGDVMERAEKIYQWLRYGNDGASEVRALLDGVTLTDAKTGETRPAKVVGRDNDIIARLRKEDGYEKDGK